VSSIQFLSGYVGSVSQTDLLSAEDVLLSPFVTAFASVDPGDVVLLHYDSSSAPRLWPFVEFLPVAGFSAIREVSPRRRAINPFPGSRLVFICACVLYLDCSFFVWNDFTAAALWIWLSCG